MSKARELMFKYLSEDSQKEYDKQTKESEAKFATFSNMQGAQILGFHLSSAIKDAVEQKLVSSNEEALEILIYSLELSAKADKLVKEAMDNMVLIESAKHAQGTAASN